MIFPCLPCGRMHYSQSLGSLGIVLSNSFSWVFTQSQIVSSHSHTNNYAAEFFEIYFSEIFWRSLEFSLCESLSSLVPCCANASCLDLPRLPALSFGFPLLGLQPGNSLKAVSWQKYTPHFISCLSGIAVFHCLLSSVVKTVSYILGFFLVVSGWTVNLVPVQILLRNNFLLNHLLNIISIVI